MRCWVIEYVVMYVCIYSYTLNADFLKNVICHKFLMQVWTLAMLAHALKTMYVWWQVTILCDGVILHYSNARLNMIRTELQNLSSITISYKYLHVFVLMTFLKRKIGNSFASPSHRAFKPLSASIYKSLSLSFRALGLDSEKFYLGRLIA